MLGWQAVACAGDRKLAVLDSAGANKSVSDFFHFRMRAADSDQFEAVVVIEVAMHRGENICAVIVLNVGEMLLQQTLVMIVNEGDATGDLVFADLLLVLHQMRTDHVGDGHRAIFVTFFANHFVELSHQFGRKRGTETGGEFFFAFGHVERCCATKLRKDPGVDQRIRVHAQGMPVCRQIARCQPRPSIPSVLQGVDKHDGPDSGGDACALE